LAVVLLLAAHLALAVGSQVRENPTIDEVIHLPAGITYWQTGTFRLYHHNPPLIKLVAALPALATGVQVDYESPSWRQEPPNKAAFAHEFMELNAARYFELFALARLPMPLFSALGGLVVYLWSAKLYGRGGGLLSLALWCSCPNILAHVRLITTDVGSTALGVIATFTFWLYLRHPSWTRALLAGLALGVAQLSKFSPILLYGLWPLIWLAREALSGERRDLGRRVMRSALQGAAMVAVSVLVIDLGYGFEGVGRPLGDFPFVSATFTRPRPQPKFQDPRPREPFGRIHEYRVNRFRGTVLGRLPSPLPAHYLLGFDDQKLEADGIWVRFLAPPQIGDVMGPDGDKLAGYPVYLDSELRDRSWWDYYLRALCYKVPEGTWFLVGLSIVVLIASPRSRAPWADELAVLMVPAAVLIIISAFTNIAIGLRYVLPIFPYLFISAGKLIPWAAGQRGPWRWAASATVGLGLVATIAATARIHPHYLAYFNDVSGGPDRGAEHLIDSNLDWGQDLVNLKRWLDKNAPGKTVGLAYFGQINPGIFALRGEGFDWFLPPPLPGTMGAGKELPPRYRGGPEASRIRPGLYAVSASLVEGLDWRVYDSSRWAPYAAHRGAFGYFPELRPFAKIGYSIFLYEVTPEDAARLARHWPAAT
jgi:hypothetical protein